MPPILNREDEDLLLRLAGAQPESAGELGELLEQLRQKVGEVVLADKRVQERLNGVRYRVLTVDYPQDKAAEGAEGFRSAEIGMYDYERDVLVVAAVDLRAGEVMELFEREGVAPPITREELDDARELASSMRDMREALADPGAQVVAFPTPSYAFEARPEALRHRGCMIYAPGPGDRDLNVAVDLSARQVVPQEELPEILRARGGASGQ